MQEGHEEYAKWCVDFVNENFVNSLINYALFLLLFWKGGLAMPAPSRNENAEFITVKMAMQNLNLCRTSTVKLAKEANALLRFGNAQRIDWNKLSKYFKEKYIEQ